MHASTFFTHSGPPRAPVPVHTQTHTPVAPENTGGVSKITLSSLLRFWFPFSVKGASRNENQDIAVLISHFMLLRAGNFPNRMFVSDDRNYNLSHSNVDLNYPTKQLGSQALNLLLTSSPIDTAEVLFWSGNGYSCTDPQSCSSCRMQQQQLSSGAQAGQEPALSPILLLAAHLHLPKYSPGSAD